MVTVAAGVVKCRADHGLSAGHDGGKVVFEGTPAQLVAAKSTLTGKHLAEFVKKEKR